MPTLWDYTESVILSNQVSVDEIDHVEFSLLSDMPAAEKHALILAAKDRFQLHLDHLRSCSVQDFIAVASALSDAVQLRVDLKIVGADWTMSVDNRCKWKFVRAPPKPTAGHIRASLIAR